MNTIQNLTNAVVVVALAGALCTTGCNKEDNNSIIVPKATNNENLRAFASGSSQGNTADKIAVEAQTLGTVSQRLSGAASSPIVTKDSVNKVIYIDFGSGIVGEDSVNRAGIIRVQYTDDYFTPGSVLTITFVNYKTNGSLLEGTRTITNMGVNGSGNMYWQVEAINMKKTAIDGVTWRKWNSSRTREMVSGFATPGDLSDDVYHINGTADGAFSNGSVFTANIIDLVRESSCLWISSGVINAVVDNKDNYSADFGNGDCDNKVVVTYPDGTVEDLFL
jgi:hypothetical protein